MVLSRTRGPWVPVVFLAVLCPAGAAAQFVSGDTDAYLALLGRYEAGDYAGAADAAARLDATTARTLGRLVLEDVDRQMLQVRRLKAATDEAPTARLMAQLRRERIRRLKLTLLVHTEAALRVNDVTGLGRQLTLADGALRRLRRLEDDFRRNGPLEPGTHPPGVPHADWDALKGFIRDWYLVVASRLQSVGALAFLKTHVRQGLELFSDDPELLLARGAISEGEADSGVVDRSLAPRIYVADYVDRWRRLMSAAGGDYEAAARRQPDLHEAVLRWGRVNSHLGDRTAARRALERVATSNAPANLRYLAQLFLGDLAERERQPERARAAYESALALFPRAQAPMLALSLLCDSAGEAECARQWLSQSMAAAARGRLDPWWAYQRGQAWLGDRRLIAFRATGLER